jgi:hypothetical protein
MQESEIEVERSSITNYSFESIEVMIDLVQDKYDKVYTNYEELAEVINKNFNTKVSENDILNYYENYYDIDLEDKKIHYKTLGY